MPRRSISRWTGDALGVPEGYKMVMRKRYNRRSAWNEFLRNSGEFKAFIDQMRTLYHQQYGGRPQPLAQYRSGGTGGAVYTGGRVRGRGLTGGWTDFKRHEGGESMFVEGHNPWLNFLHAHKGDGYSLEELSQMYHQMGYFFKLPLNTTIW
jgi:hypothetical protein